MAHTIKIQVGSTHNPAATPLDGQYHVEFIRKRLDPSELYPSYLRWNPTLSRVEYTPDGGTTWIASPDSDPRNTKGIAPLQGQSDNCRASQSVAEYFRRYISLVVSILSAGSTIVQGASALMAFLEILSGGYAILWDLLAGAVSTLTGYTASQVTLAFSSDQYDKLANILFCNMVNSQVTDASSLAAIKQQVSATLNATAAPIVNLMLDLMGFAGINRAALFYNTGRSCSAFTSCNWSYAVDLSYLDGISQSFGSPEYAATFQPTQSPAYGGLNTYLGHPALKGIKLSGFNHAAFSRVFPINIPAGSTLTKIGVWFASENTNLDNFGRFLVNLTTGQILVWTGAFHTVPMEITGSWTGLNQIYFGCRVNTTTSTGVQVEQLVLTGTGARPAIPSTTKWY